ncbi:xanthine dehydrogenase accessory factor [Sphingomonas naasensis]|uniref:XdhC family protein n=1 Tax=Sphingomonas naasensis TaxID=1344951 RepID=A0A4S1WEP9_9SPHN|nr:XdhC family protein [Sphingomonas naasensis]NIJ19907.1 xanthine dehydrogenase accessory factor [Sphingomonas naasensis]TGX39970.1 XdhC family protein [Sphingomonas naasensis]
MADNDSVLAAARSWAGAPMALATVVSTWGSAPRPRGSHMLVHEDGRFEGSVSGGCVETDILATAADVIAGAPAVVKTYGVADPAAWEVGLPCGGEIAVLVQQVSTGGFDPRLFDAIATAQAEGRSFDVASDLASGRSAAGSQGEFVNRYDPPRRLLIVGAVQIAQRLAGLARELGIVTHVIDPRGRFLTEARFPGVVLDDRWPDEAVTALRPDPATAVVTLSHDPKIDDAALTAALAHPTGYVAALGSRKSHAARLERLRVAGVAEAALARIDGPAGLDIGAIGPAEIALSIAAAMVRSFHADA